MAEAQYERSFSRNGRPEGRFHELDALRAGIMLLGISVHTALSFMATDQVPWPARDVRRSMVFDVFAGLAHSFRMPLFFVVAGFFAHLLYYRIGARAFLRHRIKRILLPFVAGIVTVVPAVRVVSVYADVRAGRLTPGEGAIGAALLEKLRSPGPFFHLWFLYYLLVLYLLVLVAHPLLVRSVRGAILDRVDAGMRRLVRGWWKPLALAVPTAVLLSAMDTAGFDSPMSLLPEGRIVLAYGVFFGFGWLLHRQPALLGDLRRGAWAHVALAVGAAFPAFGWCLLQLQVGSGAPWLRAAAVSAGALVTWLMVLGALGLAVRYLNRPSGTMRYLSDASYWLYLVHPPLVMWLHVELAAVNLPSGVKFVLIHAAAVPLMLLSYQSLVRGTIIGEVLNGVRVPRAKPASVLGPTEPA